MQEKSLYKIANVRFNRTGRGQVVDSSTGIVYKAHTGHPFPKTNTGQFPNMPLSICEPFAWYLVIRCKDCGTRQPIHRDSSEGKAELLRSYHWRCVHCQQVNVYQPAEIERYQHIVQRGARNG